MSENLWVWTTDWHVTSADTEAGGLGETRPHQAASISRYIRALAPAGVIDTGDCKDHYGLDTGDEHDQYITNVKNIIPWGTVNEGVPAQAPILPGNHDEVADYGGGVTDFSFWGAPYHWTTDWNAAQIRFIGVHTYVEHTGGLAGFFHCDADERDWLQDELDALPSGWKAIICTHPSIDPAVGNEVRADFGGTELRALLAANAAKITCCVSGHRHISPPGQTTVDGIPHITGPGVSYGTGNSDGGIMILKYTGSNIVFHALRGPASFIGALDAYTPISVAR
jgi:3',5'-cyclic AMP phosphodiesterase CpdA